MGCSEFTYAGTLYTAHKGFILIPEYAQDWAKTDKIEITKGGSYSDFKTTITSQNERAWLDGNVLIGIFKTLFEGETVPVSLEDCLFEENEFPYHNEILENLRAEGIFSDAYCNKEPYSLKIVKNADNITYENCPSFSVSGQFGYFDKDHPYYNSYFEKMNKDYYADDWRLVFSKYETNP